MNESNQGNDNGEELNAMTNYHVLQTFGSGIGQNPAVYSNGPQLLDGNEAALRLYDQNIQHFRNAARTTGHDNDDIYYRNNPPGIGPTETLDLAALRRDIPTHQPPPLPTHVPAHVAAHNPVRSNPNVPDSSGSATGNGTFVVRGTGIFIVALFWFSVKLSLSGGVLSGDLSLSVTFIRSGVFVLSVDYSIKFKIIRSGDSILSVENSITFQIFLPVRLFLSRFLYSPYDLYLLQAVCRRKTDGPKGDNQGEDSTNHRSYPPNQHQRNQPTEENGSHFDLEGMFECIISHIAPANKPQMFSLTGKTLLRRRLRMKSPPLRVTRKKRTFIVSLILRTRINTLLMTYRRAGNQLLSSLSNQTFHLSRRRLA